jgi:hypothetical protein
MNNEGFNTQIGVDPYNRFNDDPCAGKHGGNVDSMLAWERVRVGLPEIFQRILDEYEATDQPIAPKEMAYKWGVPHSNISGRFSTLKQKGILCATNQKWQNSRRLELTERWLERVLSADLTESDGAAKARTTSKAKFKPFTPDEILELNRSAGRYADEFTQMLNSAISERICEAA